MQAVVCHLLLSLCSPFLVTRSPQRPLAGQPLFTTGGHPELFNLKPSLEVNARKNVFCAPPKCGCL